MDFKGWVRLSRWRALPSLDRRGRSFALCLFASRPAPMNRADRQRQSGDRSFAAMACRRPSSSTTARPGATASRGQRWTTPLASGCSSSASPLMHSRPYHPQSRGKNERFHRTLVAEVLALQTLAPYLPRPSGPSMRWREIYNFERPHEALDHQVPASRYRPQPAIHAGASATARLWCARHRAHRLLPPKRLRPVQRTHTGKFHKPFNGERIAIRQLTPRRHLRRLLRIPPDCYDRLDQPKRCRPCPRTPVHHVPGMNNKGGGAVALSAHS